MANARAEGCQAFAIRRALLIGSGKSHELGIGERLHGWLKRADFVNERLIALELLALAKREELRKKSHGLPHLAHERIVGGIDFRMICANTRAAIHVRQLYHSEQEQRQTGIKQTKNRHPIVSFGRLLHRLFPIEQLAVHFPHAIARVDAQLLGKMLRAQPIGFHSLDALTTRRCARIRANAASSRPGHASAATSANHTPYPLRPHLPIATPH